MWFYITMFICNLFIPVIMIIAGAFMYKNPPKKINVFFGYRTKMSTKNMDTWKFAHNYCSKLWIKLGIGLLIISIIVQIPFSGSTDDGIGMMALIVEAVQLIVLVCSVVPVEKALKRNFDENGIRKTK